MIDCHTPGSLAVCGHLRARICRSCIPSERTGLWPPVLQ